jgi:hypothetical protein
LLDNNNVTGTLGQTCALDKLGVVIADCMEVDCDCCVPCCVDGTDCHDFDVVTSLDPVWEAGYDRQFFDFSDTQTSQNVGDDDEAANFGSP